MKVRIKAFWAGVFFLALPLVAFGKTALDKAPDIQDDAAALRKGALLFMESCSGCHRLNFVRYYRLTELGFSERDVRDIAAAEPLPFSQERRETLPEAGAKILYDTMRVAARAPDQKRWFGVVPPDLSLVARARASDKGGGADWIYSYLRSFHRDEHRPTGWNNTVFPQTAMPHVLWNQHGEPAESAGQAGNPPAVPERRVLKSDESAAQLTGFLVWAGEPDAAFRKQVGIGVMIFLGIFWALAYALKRDYWKDI